MTQLPQIQQIPDIDGSVLRVARESHHLSQAELAKTLCLSIKQVNQLECGEHHSFYSLKHRYQVALKVAAYLGLSDSDIRSLPGIQQLSSESQQYDDEISSLKSVRNESQPIIITNEQSTLNVPVEVELKQKKHQLGKWLFLFFGSVLTATLAIVLMMFGIPTDNQSAQIAVAKSDVGVSASPAFNLCDMTSAPSPTSLSVEAPVKRGESITIISRVDQAICIVDNNNKITSLSLLPDGKQVIIGQPPFVIQAINLNQLEIYFQGRKLRYAMDIKGPIKLTEAALSEPAN